jgi:hypothetical protein
MARIDPIVRTLYLYLFTALGLVFLAIGSVRLLDMALRAAVFKQADAMERMESPPMMIMNPRIDTWAADTGLTAQEREMLRSWIRDYERWRERSARSILSRCGGNAKRRRVWQ